MANEESQVQSRSRDKFCNRMKEIHNKASGQILDLVDVSLGNEAKFKSIRSKILRVINDASRLLEKELEKYYTMDYVSVVDDVIVFGDNKKR